MSTSRNEIIIFSYPEIIDFTNALTDLEDVADDIFDNLTTLTTVFMRLDIHPTFLERLNVRYAEKQVRGIDTNFPEYNRHIRIHHADPFAPNPPNRSYLKEKAFSGDVSGDIGESVFAYLLTIGLQMNANLLGHLRPEKLRQRLTPDFIIWEQNLILSTFLGPYRLPLYAEVKSSTGMMDPKRIATGLEQLKTVMDVPNSHGLLFLLHRLPGQTYSALMVGVKS